MKRKIIASVLALALVLASTGCQGAGDEQNSDKKMWPWINSNVVGAVTADTEAELSDDFYLAVNKEYLQNTKPQEGRVAEDSFQEVADVTNEKAIQMLDEGGLKGHDGELVSEMYAMFLDWDARNAQGMTNVIPHIEAIQKITTLDELSTYLTSEEGFIYGTVLCDTDVMEDLQDSQWYALYLDSLSLSLGDSAEYKELTSVGERRKEIHRRQAQLLLEKVGYKEAEIEDILEKEYAFEEKLAPTILTNDEQHQPDFYQRILNSVTLEDLEEISPNYPIVQILKMEGYADSQRIYLMQPEWLTALNELYTEENLEEMKSYILVNTLLGFGNYVDEDTYRSLQAIRNEVRGVTGTISDKEAALDVLTGLMPESLSKVYVERYISAEMRDDIKAIIAECVDAYRTMLSEEDWLSEETRQKAIEKLDNIKVNAVYPDEWKDMSGLQITARKDGGSYMQACFEVANYRLEERKAHINAKVETLPLSDNLLMGNAYYRPTDNSINIFPGLLGGQFYDPDRSREENLAGIGTTIGHEISHAFDTMGGQFDKDGNMSSWWAETDYNAFEKRAQKLIDYYNAIVPFDGGKNYPGANVQGEAIADIAGMKCILQIAKGIDGFDYDLFFRSYEKLWKEVCTREISETVVYEDVHPASYLRGNITVMQQPEFYETYGIQEGDGMYLAPEDRIAVW